ncbi:MAG: type II toxin-antitoxin system HicA family toxin [Thermomicrobiales bacterium]
MIRQRELLRVLHKVGWYIARTEDHHILKRSDGPGRVIVPLHRDIKPGTFHNILKQAGLALDEFEALRKD